MATVQQRETEDELRGRGARGLEKVEVPGHTKTSLAIRALEGLLWV